MSATATLTLRELHHAHVAPTIREPRRSLRQLYAELMEDPDLSPPPRAETPLTAWT